MLSIFFSLSVLLFSSCSYCSTVYNIKNRWAPRLFKCEPKNCIHHCTQYMYKCSIAQRGTYGIGMQKPINLILECEGIEIDSPYEFCIFHPCMCTLEMVEAREEMQKSVRLLGYNFIRDICLLHICIYFVRGESIVTLVQNA